MSLWRGIRARLAGPEPMDRLFVGLGNPGPRYEGTRHNLGREAIEALAARWQVELSDIRSNARFGIVRRGDVRICLAVPITYMNESGRAVAPLAQFFKVPVEQVVVAFDDLDLPLGSIRLRGSGGAGGHRGMRSIASALGTEEFPRLRLGIGRPPSNWDASDYVLSRFDDDERGLADAAVNDAVEALEALSDRGLNYAMNAHNG